MISHFQFLLDNRGGMFRVETHSEQQNENHEETNYTIIYIYSNHRNQSHTNYIPGPIGIPNSANFANIAPVDSLIAATNSGSD